MASQAMVYMCPKCGSTECFAYKKAKDVGFPTAWEMYPPIGFDYGECVAELERKTEIEKEKSDDAWLNIEFALYGADKREIARLFLECCGSEKCAGQAAVCVWIALEITRKLKVDARRVQTLVETWIEAYRGMTIARMALREASSNVEMESFLIDLKVFQALGNTHTGDVENDTVFWAGFHSFRNAQWEK